MQRQLWILTGLSVIVIVAAIILPPTPQSASYHQFADQQVFLGIPNFRNVVSNLAIFMSGIAGLRFLSHAHHVYAHKSFSSRVEYWPYLVLFSSVTAAGLGSMIYHWNPHNDYLVLDRLPIAMGVTALLAATIVERISPTLGIIALPVLVAMGMFSVFYWYWTENQGNGNLNFYILTQFYSILLIILLSVCYSSRYTHAKNIYQIIFLYAIAKALEMFDLQVYHVMGGLISGHTIKHLLVGFAVYQIVWMLQKRTLYQKINRPISDYNNR